MSIMIEVHYRKPVNSTREKAIISWVSRYSGELTFREDDAANSICLTLEFPNWELALEAASKLREAGMHVEGPMDYGDDLRHAMVRVILEHGVEHRIENPSIEQVVEVMQRAKIEDGPPELQLYFGDRNVGQPQLWIMCLFARNGQSAEWCVRFVRFKAKSSQYLASALPSEDVFLERTRCGSIENVRRECVLDEAIVLEAVDWFLKHGTPHPSLVWIESSRCFRGV
jgi:hypothetical protein